jgi:hypothetical protein
MLGIIGNKFSIGKETYHAYAAEFHYFRVDKRYWSICFERIKRAGFRIITSTVPWGVHQDQTKHIDFNGYDDPRKDLVVFLELAREFSFKVILRPGPWVAGQLPYGGLPKYLFNDIKILARNAAGHEVKIPDMNGVDGGYLPSFLHSNFQFHLKTFFRAFIEITKNYVHPRGPIFMVELDHETSFARLLDPGSADYNPDIVSSYYPEFLLGLYEDIKKLNARYKEKNESFEKVEPPRKFDELKLESYPKVIDWIKFRQYLLNTYLATAEDMFTAYTVEPLMFRSLYFRPGDLLPAFNLVPEDRSPFLGSNVLSEGSYFDLVNKARFLKAEYGFAFASSFTSGRAATDPDRESKLSPVTEAERRFYLAAASSAGFKGLNHYMFVDRDHWYGAPLHFDGTVAEGFDVVRNFTTAVSTIGFEEMEFEPEVAVLGNRFLSWLRLVSSKEEFTYIPRLLDDTAVGFCRDLMRLKLAYGIRENREWESMKKYKVLFVPSAEVMSERDQEGLVELAKAGVTLFMVGHMPRYDEEFKPCTVLSNHFRIKTTTDYGIGRIEHKNGAFTSYTYASIKTTDDGKVKKLAKSDQKLVAVCSTRFKGSLYFFSFDIASGGDHQKLAFIESLLEGEKITSWFKCSDPSVDLSFYGGDKKGVLFVVAPPPGELSDGMEARNKEIIIQADLKQAGFSAATIKLTDLFAGETAEPIKTTAKDLKTGIALRVNFPDGLAFLVEKR